MRRFFLLSAILCGAAVCGMFTPALTAPTGFAVLDDARAFRGRITYVVHRTDAVPSPRVDGTLTVGSSPWLVEEHSSAAYVTADNIGGTLEGGGFRTAVDDPLASGAVDNAWAVAIGALSAASEMRALQGASVWEAGQMRIYLNDTRDRVEGLADTAGSGDVSFAFDGWQDVAGVQLPASIVRLHDGVPEGTYSIEEYAVTRSPSVAAAAPPAPPTMLPDKVGSAATVAATPPTAADRADFPWRWVSSAFGALLLAVVFVAWTRRDAILEDLRRRVQTDPRGWQARGVTVFVSSDGRMWYDGAEYVIGPQFYGRRAVVQSSPLFLRIGASEVPRAVVVARKFRIPALRAARIDRSRSAGLSLIENIVAIGLFSTVVVGAVYPTLIVMANGDRIARAQSAAVRLAANALNDEEIASAYGVVDEGSVRSQAGDMTVVVTVGPSQSGVAGAHDIDVAVVDAKGRFLAHAISTVGPAVPAPPPPGHTPNPSPGPTG